MTDIVPLCMCACAHWLMVRLCARYDVPLWGRGTPAGAAVIDAPIASTDDIPHRAGRRREVR